jgi:hypothetical protein
MASAPPILTIVADITTPVTQVSAKVTTIVPDLVRVRANFVAVGA